MYVLDLCFKQQNVKCLVEKIFLNYPSYIQEYERFRKRGGGISCIYSRIWKVEEGVGISCIYSRIWNIGGRGGGIFCIYSRIWKVQEGREWVYLAYIQEYERYRREGRRYILHIFKNMKGAGGKGGGIFCIYSRIWKVQEGGEGVYSAYIRKFVRGGELQSVLSGIMKGKYYNLFCHF